MQIAASSAGAAVGAAAFVRGGVASADSGAENATDAEDAEDGGRSASKRAHRDLTFGAYSLDVDLQSSSSDAADDLEGVQRELSFLVEQTMTIRAPPPPAFLPYIL
jgi:hypothetical protein